MPPNATTEKKETLKPSISRHTWRWCNPALYSHDIPQDSIFSMIDISVWTRNGALGAPRANERRTINSYFQSRNIIESILAIGFQNNDLAEKTTNWLLSNADYCKLSDYKKAISKEAMCIGIVNLILHAVPIALRAISLLIMGGGLLGSIILRTIFDCIFGYGSEGIVVILFTLAFTATVLLTKLSIDLASVITQVALLIPKLLIFFPVLLLLNASYSNDANCTQWWSRKSVEEENVGYTNVFLSILIGASLVPAIAITTAFLSPAAPVLTAFGILCAKISAFLSASAPIAVVTATTLATGSAIAGAAIAAPSVAYTPNPH